MIKVSEDLFLPPIISQKIEQLENSNVETWVKDNLVEDLERIRNQIDVAVKKYRMKANKKQIMKKKVA